MCVLAYLHKELLETERGREREKKNEARSRWKKDNTYIQVVVAGWWSGILSNDETRCLKWSVVGVAATSAPPACRVQLLAAAFLRELYPQLKEAEKQKQKQKKAHRSS